MEMGFVEGLCLRLVVLHCLELVCLVIKLELDFIAAIVFEKLIGLFMLYHVFGLSMKCCFALWYQLRKRYSLVVLLLLCFIG